jgi:glyoxylase-like metal-dependent hydrolase (beta-lactamase superfamily II)
MRFRFVRRTSRSAAGLPAGWLAWRPAADLEVRRTALLLVGLALASTAFAQSDVHVWPVQGNLYLLVSPGGNMAVQAGKDGVLLVDTGNGKVTSQILAAIRTISDKPIRYILNTHFHADHTGGNEAMAKAGVTIEGGPGFGAIGVNTGTPQGAHVYAHENVLNRMSAPSGKQSPVPTSFWPTDTYFAGDREVFFNGESVQMIHQPAAHTDGDSIIYFRRSDVVVTGDIFVTTTFPVIDLANGGTIQGEIDGLNRILDLAIPEHEQEGGTYVIPGHGRICDEADVVEYRDMVTIIRDRIRDMKKKNMTLEQVKGSRPARDFDARYGDPATFIEAVYKTLK